MKRVTAAIIEKNGKILVTQRPRTDKLGLKWEFPGGKIEPGETPEQCLVREIKEELNLDIKITGHFMNSTYKYETGEIELICYFAEITAGEIKLNFHEAAKWTEKGKLNEFDFAPADIPVGQKIRVSVHL
ncbi:MAG: (deoxy)nucleoside triphosphate pyrophosphohydrolase [Firmicutes bacterium]|nr:(deoxy)nucleoside triphosphate pyrophosphohydrolase [Bacillota bacterium]